MATKMYRLRKILFSGFLCRRLKRMEGGEGITHRFIETNGIKMHIAEQGSGPLVLLLHGFPELWYSWRHQIPALAKAGYHVVAPDMRGYGQTDAPVGVEKYTTLHVVGDIIGLLDALNEQQAFVAGHDWGAVIAWDLCLFRPDRVKAVAALSVPFWQRNPGASPLQQFEAELGEGFYFCRFQEPGRAEADFGRFDTKTLMKVFLLSSKPDLPIAPKDKELCEIVEPPKELPSWITEEEIDYFAEQFSKTGFTAPLNGYRAAHLSWELKAPWTGHKTHVPALYITGDRDVVYYFPGIQDYVHKGGFVKDVPNLKETIVLPAAHFMQQEKPREISELLIKFFGENST